MPKQFFKAHLINPFRSKVPRGFYGPLGHTGEDRDFVFELFPTPITGKVEQVLNQTEMGWTIYIRDAWDNIHVFSHFKELFVRPGDIVARLSVIGLTGNSGSKTTNPHTHGEIICWRPWRLGDVIMVRSLAGYRGWNTEPTAYYDEIYEFHGVDMETGMDTRKEIGDGGWIASIKKKTKKIPYPKWLK